MDYYQLFHNLQFGSKSQVEGNQQLDPHKLQALMTALLYDLMVQDLTFCLKVDA